MGKNKCLNVNSKHKKNQQQTEGVVCVCVLCMCVNYVCVCAAVNCEECVRVHLQLLQRDNRVCVWGETHLLFYMLCSQSNVMNFLVSSLPSYVA